MLSRPNPNQEAGFSWLLISDVDGTLLGDRPALESFCDHLASRPDLLLVLNSSRPVKSVQQSLAALPVAIPIAGIIGAMGTEILLGDQWDTAWTASFGAWDRAAVDDLMRSLGIRPHADEFQTPFKASFEVPAHLQQAVRQTLHDLELPVTIVRSGPSDFDVLPPEAGKGPACSRVAEHLGIPPERLLVAGDSANDRTMFDISLMGIVVANAREELIEHLDPVRSYFAPHPFAQGVLDGLSHWIRPPES